MRKAKEMAGEIAVNIGILLMVGYAVLFFWLCGLFGIDLNDDF